MKDVSVCVAQVKIRQQVFFLASLDMALSKVVTDAIIFQSENQAEKVLGGVERELEERLGSVLREGRSGERRFFIEVEKRDLNEAGGDGVGTIARIQRLPLAVLVENLGISSMAAANLRRNGRQRVPADKLLQLAERLDELEKFDYTPVSIFKIRKSGNAYL